MDIETETFVHQRVPARGGLAPHGPLTVSGDTSGFQISGSKEGVMGGLLASRGLRPEMLLSVFPHPAQTSAVPGLRDSGVCGGGWGRS